MNIGIDCRLWNESGVGRYIRNLVKEIDLLEAKNPTHTYTLFMLPKDIGEYSYVSQSFHEVVADVRWHSVREQMELPKIIAKQHLDFIHFPYFSIPLSYKHPFMVTVHDLIIYHHATGKASTLPKPLYSLKHHAYKKVLKYGIEKSRHIIAPTKFVQQDIYNHFEVPKEKITVTYEGVDDGLQSIIDTKTHGTYDFLDGIPYLLYVGNAYPHKNVETLIKAFKKFKEDHPEHAPVHLVLVGKKDYFYDRIEATVEKSDSIVFIHDATDKDLAFLYQHAKSFITTSISEGFGLPILEAMSQKCLVVCSEIPVFKEIASTWPIYCNPTKLDSIISAIQNVLVISSQDKSRRIAGGKKQSSQFSWKQMAKETIAVYNTFLSQEKSHS